MDRIFLYGVKAKREFIVAFTFFYLVLFFGTILGSVPFGTDPGFNVFRPLAILSGKTAIIFFILTIAPGIGRRMGVSSKALQFLMLFRRQLGLMVFYLVLFHLSTVWFLPSMKYLGTIFPLNRVQLVGGLAFIFLIPLFLTSNRWSVQKLGVWWKRIHSLVYIIAWLMFLHVAFQSSWLWASIIGTAAVLETISFIIPKKKSS